MKRLLIAEVEPGNYQKRCPCARVARENMSTCTCTYGPYGSCSDENCPLPKVDGTTKRLLIREVNPLNPYRTSRPNPCPYMYYSLNSRWKCWKWVCNHHLGYNAECSNNNCPLPRYSCIDSCPYMHYHRSNESLWKCNHLENDSACSDENCPLPTLYPDKLEPDKEEEI
jgi:hypothetical protein